MIAHVSLNPNTSEKHSDFQFRSYGDPINTKVKKGIERKKRPCGGLVGWGMWRKENF